MRAMLMAGLAALAMAAAGCATSGEAPGEAGATYRALGTEPFWSVTIGDGRMVFDTPEGGFTVAAPAPRATGSGRRYETARLTVDIAAGECSDGMSDRRFADTVRVTADGRALSGCGGDILPPEALAGTNWAIVEIGGEAVSGELYHLSFTGDQISGRAGCNRFTGGYRLTDGILTAGGLAMTRMACPGPGMAHEQRAAEVLGGPARVSFPDGDTLLLTGPTGALRAARAI